MALYQNPAYEKSPRKPPTWLWKPHPDGCACSRCDLSPIQCPVYEGGVQCEKVCHGRRSLGTHVVFKHKRRKRKMAPVLVPDGLGYLTRTLQDPQKIYGIDLSALPRFARSLTQSTVLRLQHRRGRAATRYLLERAQSNLDGFLTLSQLKVPGKLVEPIALLAKLADVPPWVVVDALLAYGLELLAKELREYRTAPDPHIPSNTPPNTTKLPEG